MILAKKLPWYLKIPAKVVLSRIPVDWRGLPVFRHGAMLDPDYAIRVFDSHFGRAGLAPGAPFTVLELGPGDSLATAVIAAAYGAVRTYLIDVGDFAGNDAATYRLVAKELRARGRPSAAEFHTVREMLHSTGARYFTTGLRAFAEIPSGSVDFVFSHSVLEHVGRDEMADTLREMRRVLRPNGVASHNIDLRDHLGGALDHLRFSPHIWEAPLMARSGFYTNRYRHGELMEMFRTAGFHAALPELHRWPDLPTPRARLDTEFQRMSDDDLRVSGFDVVLRPA